MAAVWVRSVSGEPMRALPLTRPPRASQVLTLTWPSLWTASRLSARTGSPGARVSALSSDCRMAWDFGHKIIPSALSGSFGGGLFYLQVAVSYLEKRILRVSFKFGGKYSKFRRLHADYVFYTFSFTRKNGRILWGRGSFLVAVFHNYIGVVALWLLTLA